MKKWYVIHTQTGSEDKVKTSLEKRILAEGMQDLFGQVFIPTEQVSEIKGGKKTISQRKFFPGYILVEMDLNEKSMQFIRKTPGVTRFIGAGRQPTALNEDEIKNVLKVAEDRQSKPTPKVSFEDGEAVRVIDGPFVNFSGTVESIHPEKGKLKVSVSVFGRATPIELEYWQVEKV